MKVSDKSKPEKCVLYYFMTEVKMKLVSNLH